MILSATTTLQTVYAQSLTVDLIKSAFGVSRATAKITGPCGYKDGESVATGPNAQVTFNIPDNQIPSGQQFKICNHSEGIIGPILPNCMFFTYGGGNPSTWMNVPG